jgi:hypothetical protein
MVAAMLTKRFTGPAAVVPLAGLLAACGSDGDSGGSDDGVASASGDDSNERAQGNDQADAEAELLDWVECMRDEGIDIPDPTRDADGNLVIEGPGFRLGGGDADGSTSSDDGGEGDEQAIDPEEMDAAMEACGQPPALGPNDISDEDRQAMEPAALEFAECMRDEGIEHFPDPDFSDMGPGGEPQQRSSEDEGGGDGGPRVFLGPLGEIDLNDPEVAAAFEASQDLLGGPERPGGPAQPESDQSAAA